MEWIGRLGEEKLNYRQMSAGASEGQRRMIVIGCLPVYVGTLGYKELHSAKMPGPASLHQRRSSTLGLVLLE